ncbi:MAG: DUF4386 domain-containing protein [Polyangiaceae bacterium]
MQAGRPQSHARIAGAAYLLVIVIGILNGFLIDLRLIVASDDAATAHNILAQPMLFRAGMAATLVLYALVIVLAWALYELLKVVEPGWLASGCCSALPKRSWASRPS